MTPPCPDLGDDILIWGLEPNGSYSVKTGYLLAKELVERETNGTWKKIWSWKGPQRVRQFLWTAVHNRLLTNTERQRRHLTNSTDCGLCVDTPESLDHILRHSPLAEQVWLRTLPPANLVDFFSLDPGEWWKRYIGDGSLSTVFGFTCWLLWKARNERIFEGKSVTVHGILEQARFWLNASNSTYQSVVDLKRSQGKEGTTTQIYWKPAQEPGFTLNTDGSVQVSAQRARQAAACEIRRVESLMPLQPIWGIAQSLGRSSQVLSLAWKGLGTLAFGRSKSKLIMRLWLSWFRRTASESINMQR
ncbi:Putative ribonuclease H protein At1g65750 [Linum perenne]